MIKICSFFKKNWGKEGIQEAEGIVAVQSAGRETVKVLPWPGVLSTSILPPWAAAMDWAILSPRPAPPPLCDLASAAR